MSDFGELCPLFNTGVYNEVTLSFIGSVSSISSTMNLLETRVTAGTGGGRFTFGRTVVVTDVYIRRYLTNLEAENLYLQHRSSAEAAATSFATATVTSTVDAYSALTWWKMTTASATFASSDVLSLGVGTLTAVTQGGYHLIVRYREK